MSAGIAKVLVVGNVATGETQTKERRRKIEHITHIHIKTRQLEHTITTIDISTYT